MGFKKLALLSVALAALPQGLAFAQTSTYTPTAYYGATAQTASAPLYNTTAQPYMPAPAVAGQNAPSYVYGASNTSSYTYGSSGSANTYVPQGTLTPQQEAAFAQQLAQQQALYMSGQPYYAAPGSLQEQLDALNASHFGAEEDQKSKQRVVKQVVRNALNDPLSPPPRLFNPDQ
jgi:hypothetical protein